MHKRTWEIVSDLVAELPDLESQAREAVRIVSGSPVGLQIIRDTLVERGGPTGEAWSRFTPGAVKAFAGKLASWQVQ